MARDHDRPAPPLLLVEAGAAVLAASLLIRLAPFRTVAGRLSRRKGDWPAAEAETIYWLRRAVLAWCRRVPWRALCFEQGLALHLLIERRGLASTLHYGAATVEGDLKAHVWVTSGDQPVIGCDIRDDFALLARFPE